jgi:ppGpp synthetase/RelA/SpoT-type nucleotidyltranferase
MAKLVEEKLKVLLDEAGVKCKLSRRVKHPKSLQEKLVDRNRRRKEGYKDFQEIKRDIADLAGVRIILYMPTKEDYTKVKELVQKEWGPGIASIPHAMDRSKEQSRIKPGMHSFLCTARQISIFYLSLYLIERISPKTLQRRIF